MFRQCVVNVKVIYFCCVIYTLGRNCGGGGVEEDLIVLVCCRQRVVAW